MAEVRPVSLTRMEAGELSGIRSLEEVKSCQRHCA